MRQLFVLLLVSFLSSSYQPAEIADTTPQPIQTDESSEYSAETLYTLWGIDRTNISLSAFRYAYEGYRNLQDLHLISQTSRLTVIDFTLPSVRNRLAVIDMETGRVEFTTLVAHGRNSGDLMATRFSNIPQSYQSSLGFYLTAETYAGKHGYSLRLDGLEKGFNDKARERAIVIHGADYATSEFASIHGRLGRSFGCPAVPPSQSKKVIDEIKDKQVVFIYSDDRDYLERSPVLNHTI